MPFRRAQVLYLLAGGSRSHLANAWRVYKNVDLGDGPTSFNTEIDLERYTVNQFYGDFGLGAALNAGKRGRVFVEGRWQAGLTYLAERKDRRHNTLLLAAGYALRL